MDYKSGRCFMDDASGPSSTKRTPWKTRIKSSHGSASNSTLSREKDTPSKEDTSSLEAEEPNNGRAMTPPIQPSQSPDISVATKTTTVDNAATSPPCYSAGHLPSGVRDSRKCRPRGLLSATGIKEEESGASPLSSPVHATIRWLSSPTSDYSNVCLSSDWCNVCSGYSSSAKRRGGGRRHLPPAVLFDTKHFQGLL